MPHEVRQRKASCANLQVLSYPVTVISQQQAASISGFLTTCL